MLRFGYLNQFLSELEGLDEHTFCLVFGWERHEGLSYFSAFQV